MPVDYSKWDALELSDDSDIEVHPNVDKRSFIRAKQNQIHQERHHRKHQITTLKYERIINDGMLSRIDALVSALKSHVKDAKDAVASESQRSPDELVFQSLMESADPANDMPPKAPEGVHENVKDQPSYSKMMAALVDQVKKAVDEKKPSDRLSSYLTEINSHRDRILDLQQQLLQKLAELEKAEGSKITSESIHFGFNSSHVAKGDAPAAASASSSSKSTTTTSTELLNAPQRSKPQLTDDDDGPSDSGFEADSEDNASRAPANTTATTSSNNSDDIDGPSALGAAFGKLSINDHRALYAYISSHPGVLAERETDGLLVSAFDAQLAGKEDEARRCVHQALLLQYCRALGKDGVALFFKRIAGQAGRADAKKVFYDDVNQTYARLKERAAAMAAQDAENAADGEGVEQIQLHAVNPGQKIMIRIPDAEGPAKEIFDSFPPGLQRALKSESLDEVNKVLGKMSVEDAEEVVGKLSEGGMLSLEEGVVDATTEEGRETLRKIEAGEVEYADDEADVGAGPGDAVLDGSSEKDKAPVVEEVD